MPNVNDDARGWKDRERWQRCCRKSRRTWPLQKWKGTLRNLRSRGQCANLRVLKLSMAGHQPRRGMLGDNEGRALIMPKMKPARRRHRTRTKSNDDHMKAQLAVQWQDNIPGGNTAHKRTSKHDITGNHDEGDRIRQWLANSDDGCRGGDEYNDELYVTALQHHDEQTDGWLSSNNNNEHDECNYRQTLEGKWQAKEMGVKPQDRDGRRMAP